jgi:DNA repair protein RadA/Sms
MPKQQSIIYVCQQCGTETSKWQGRCFNCGAWNSLVESLAPKKTGKTAGISLINGSKAELVDLRHIETAQLPRQRTGFEEVDRVLGGGLVAGSVILIGGEPGIGKSTLLLQIIMQTGGIYVSAEESAHQVKLRADRIGTQNNEVQLLPTNDIDAAIASIESQAALPKLIIIDSIQTIATSEMESVPGSVGQVRECANRLVNLAKRTNIPVIIVSHVTKEGTIAGPKVLEHVVDAVLYVEGEELSMVRILRGIKNRFGTVNEVGLFELKDKGMVELLDAERVLVPQGKPTYGSVVTATMEGMRPMLLEIQALTTPTSFGLPRRTANGMDYNRLQMLIAVLTKRTKLSLGNQDVYTNITGGMKIKETSLDLAVCLALASSLINKPLTANTVVFGEVSLSGEIKAVLGQQRRLDQAKKLGYKHSITPENVQTLAQAIRLAFPQGTEVVQ